MGTPVQLGLQDQLDAVCHNWFTVNQAPATLDVWSVPLLGIYAPYTFPYQIRILSFLFRFFIFYKFLPLRIYRMSCLELSTLFYLVWH